MRWSLVFLAGWMMGCGSGGSSAGATSAGGEPNVVIEDDDPRVSRSAGEEGGVVVLYPRVMGLPDQEPAALQRHMVELVERVFPNRPVDVRPDPERVCPASGCLGISLGALLVAQDGRCATVGVVGGPGRANLTLLRWSGDLTVRDRVIPFREPPESHVTMHDAAPCERLIADLAEEDAAVEEALRRAAGY